MSETKSFPRSFWTANVTELFERGAYYAMASFVVIYLGQLGFGDYWPSTINSILWGLVYFLPILSGTIADQVGFKRSLLVAFVLLAIGYSLMGVPVWFGGAALNTEVASELSVGPSTMLPILLGVLLIGMGGSVIKPCISGTVQKTAGFIGRATLGFAIFYMVINIGSLFGRGVAYTVRTHSTLSSIFAVSLACSIVALLTVALIYRDPEQEIGAGPAKPRKPVGRILADMVLVLGNLRFALFLLVSSGFTFVYAQVYNVLPLYTKKVVETSPAMDVYTMANPLIIVAFQLVITRFFGRMKPIRSMVVGSIIVGLAMLINLVPVFASGGLRTVVAELPAIGALPLASLFIVLTVAMIAFGELFTSARTYEYIGALAPQGQEGLFLGYANLPMALGAIAGGPVGAVIFNELMCHNATRRPDGLLDLDPSYSAAGWLLLMGIGFLSALSMWLYNRWIEKQTA